jgi:hypothetical protein
VSGKHDFLKSLLGSRVVGVESAPDGYRLCLEVEDGAAISPPAHHGWSVVVQVEDPESIKAVPFPGYRPKDGYAPDGNA